MPDPFPLITLCVMYDQPITRYASSVANQALLTNWGSGDPCSDFWFGVTWYEPGIENGPPRFRILGVRGGSRTSSTADLARGMPADTP